MEGLAVLSNEDRDRTVGLTGLCCWWSAPWGLQNSLIRNSAGGSRRVRRDDLAGRRVGPRSVCRWELPVGGTRASACSQDAAVGSPLVGTGGTAACLASAWMLSPLDP